jgi:hypothetical protein
MEMFIFTDNSVAESAFFKGTSSNRLLLVLRLRRVKVDHSLQLHVIHISGKRMMAQGTDSLSRGDPSKGVMSCSPFLDFVPIHQSAMQRSRNIVSWCISWMPAKASLIPLTPMDWFIKGHGIIGGHNNLDGVWLPTLLDPRHNILLWCPPPAAADVAVEQLSVSRHKRPYLTHLFICPRLMTNLWWKRLLKIADFTFTLPAGYNKNTWPAHMYEPLTIGILLPLLPSPPWFRRGCPSLLALEGELRAVWQNPQGNECALLRKLWV